MYAWNKWVQHSPIHADADLPLALEAFSKQEAAHMQADTAFRRCYTAYLLNLWKFRLLMPAHLHQLMAALPALG